MRRSRSTLLVAALTLSSPAFAQPQPSAADEEPACAVDIRDEFERGGRLYEDRQYAAAATVFEPLMERCATPRLLFYLGAAWRASGRVQSAIGAWERYLGSGGVAHAEEVRRDLVELRRARVELDARVTPPEATITVDGRPYPARSPPRYLDPVEHVIEVSAPGHVPHRQDVPAQRGGRVTLAVTLRLSETTGRLAVEASVASALIRLNGAHAGVGRVARDVSPGSWLIEVSAPEFEAWRRTVAIERGALLRVDAVLARTPARRPWLLPTVIASGVVLIAGVTAMVLWFTRGTEDPLTPLSGMNVPYPSE